MVSAWQDFISIWSLAMSQNKYAQEAVFNDTEVHLSALSDPLDYAEHLDQYRDQLSWLQALFVAIQSDPDIELGFNVHNLASIGNYLSQNWMSQIESMRKVKV
jgi:hypothetical protein